MTVLYCPRCLLQYARPVDHCGLDGTALVSSDTDPLVGHRIERYEIQAVIGAGAQARIYRARHTGLDRLCAVKVPFGELAADTEFAARFRQEAEVAMRVRHPNIVHTLDLNTTPQGLPLLSMELLVGESLAYAMHESRLPEADVSCVAADIAAGLADLHDQALVHRDVKPGNVMLVDDEDGWHAKLLDFGIVRDDARPASLTSVGQIMGTVTYMAPEQILGEAVGPAADLYALGVVLYEMLAGEPPFVGPSQSIMFQKLGYKPPTPPSDCELGKLACALLSQKPANRPDARHVIDVTKAIDGDPTLIAVPIAPSRDGLMLPDVHDLEIDAGSRALFTPPPARSDSQAPLLELRAVAVDPADRSATAAVRSSLWDEPASDSRATLASEPARDVRRTLDDEPAHDVRRTLDDEPAHDVRRTIDDGPARDMRRTLDDGPARDVRPPLAAPGAPRRQPVVFLPDPSRRTLPQRRASVVPPHLATPPAIRAPRAVAHRAVAPAARWRGWVAVAATVALCIAAYGAGRHIASQSRMVIIPSAPPAGLVAGPAIEETNPRREAAKKPAPVAPKTRIIPKAKRKPDARVARSASRQFADLDADLRRVLAAKSLTLADLPATVGPQRGHWLRWRTGRAAPSADLANASFTILREAVQAAGPAPAKPDLIANLERRVGRFVSMYGLVEADFEALGGAVAEAWHDWRAARHDSASEAKVAAERLTHLLVATEIDDDLLATKIERLRTFIRSLPRARLIESQPGLHEVLRDIAGLEIARSQASDTRARRRLSAQINAVAKQHRDRFRSGPIVASVQRHTTTATP